jgi:hypothetical protein
VGQISDSLASCLGAQVTQIAPKIWVVAGSAGEGGHLRFAPIAGRGAHWGTNCGHEA